MIFLTIIFSVIAATIYANKLEHHSFVPPFSATTTQGERIVNDYWDTSGTTVVNNNFIRLTPDRQSRRGGLWSTKNLGVEEFSAILKFRISGQGEKFFGDGIAFWITDAHRHFDGPLHGSPEVFKGVGIIFDTFKNVENLAAHRDVMILANNGRKSLEDMTTHLEQIKGCPMNMRYHDKRSDFSVTDASRVKIVVNGFKVKIQVDENNSGKWEDCVEVPLDGDYEVGDRHWVEEAYIGITATTGQLADNHDIISLESFSDRKVMERDEVEKMNKKDILFEPSQPAEVKIEVLSKAVQSLLSRIETLEHEYEHKHLGVTDDVQNLLKKINEKQGNTEEHVSALEDKIHGIVAEHVGTHVLGKLDEMQEDVHARMNDVSLRAEGSTSSMDKEFEELKKIANDKIRESSSSRNDLPLYTSWPFIVVVLFMIGTVGFGFWFYFKMRKMHIL